MPASETHRLLAANRHAVYGSTASSRRLPPVESQSQHPNTLPAPATARPPPSRRRLTLRQLTLPQQPVQAHDIAASALKLLAGAVVVGACAEGLDRGGIGRPLAAVAMLASVRESFRASERMWEQIFSYVGTRMAQRERPMQAALEAHQDMLRDNLTLYLQIQGIRSAGLIIQGLNDLWVMAGAVGNSARVVHGD
jgi:hypothetical protein